MRRHPRPYMKIVHAVTEKDLLSLVKSRPLDGWQETLAILCAYSDSNEFIDLCNALARRLSGVGLGHPAALVWICAGNVEKVIKHWVHTLQKAHSSSLELETVVERAVILDLGTQSPMTAPAFSDLVNQYAAILASQGQMPMALEFLDLVKGESTSSTAILRDRIVRSGAPGVENRSAPFPFIAEDVAGTLAPGPPCLPPLLLLLQPLVVLVITIQGTRTTLPGLMVMAMLQLLPLRLWHHRHQPMAVQADTGLLPRLLTRAPKLSTHRPRHMEEVMVMGMLAMGPPFQQQLIHRRLSMYL
eukprot:jgi/Botrbrau1/2362/Bobra.39_1s0046.1